MVWEITRPIELAVIYYITLGWLRTVAARLSGSFSALLLRRAPGLLLPLGSRVYSQLALAVVTARLVCELALRVRKRRRSRSICLNFPRNKPT